MPRNQREVPIEDLLQALSTLRLDGEEALIPRETVSEVQRALSHLSTVNRGLRVLNRLQRVFLTVDDDEMYGEVLEVVLEVLESRLGVFAYIDEEDAVVCPSMTHEVRDICGVGDTDTAVRFPRHTWAGIWGRMLSAESAARSEGPFEVPGGHGPIARAMCAPIVCRDHAVGHFLVANKPTKYTAEDEQTLTMIAELVAPILSARLVRERERARRAAAEEALERAVADLERSNAELAVLATVAAHDLREPLRTVMTSVQLLKRRHGDQLDPRATRLIDRAIDAARRLGSMGEDVLSYARARTTRLRLLPVDAGAVVDRVFQHLASQIGEERATVTRGDLPVLTADEALLTRLFQNLVSNAIRFGGDEPPQVHISAAREDDVWRFAVRDSGIGIAPEDVERIFRPFEQVHGREDHPGTGIGLAICTRIVERHGGTMWVESAPAEGSTFYFTIRDQIGTGDASDSHG
jgi:signal transduction histidine kinase